MQMSLELSREDCTRLLAAGLVARVAVSTPTGPEIIPVNCSMVDDYMVIRTTPYSVLGSNAPGTVVALEIDDLDYENQRGWSVMVRGRAELVTAAADIERIQHVWNPNAWAAGTRSAYLRIPLTEISGRQLGHGWSPTRHLPVRRVV